MLYKKPQNLKYTDMAIYIDNTVYTDQCDDNLIFEYLWHIANMLAHKAKFFKNNQYYEDFAVYMATT